MLAGYVSPDSSMEEPGSHGRSPLVVWERGKPSRREVPGSAVLLVVVVKPEKRRTGRSSAFMTDEWNGRRQRAN